MYILSTPFSIVTDMPNDHDLLTLHFPSIILKMHFENKISASLLLVLCETFFKFVGFHFSRQ